MGGLGSGRRSKRRKVAECLTMDINRLLRTDLFYRRSGRLYWPGDLTTECIVHETEDGSRKLVLSYSADWAEQTVPLTTTQLVSGGLRWYFVCPRCGRRAAKLYLPPGEQAFGCRACYDLAYPGSRRKRERCLDVSE
jgi:hypothetical protein